MVIKGNPRSADDRGRKKTTIATQERTSRLLLPTKARRGRFIRIKKVLGNCSGGEEIEEERGDEQALFSRRSLAIGGGWGNEEGGQRTAVLTRDEK